MKASMSTDEGHGSRDGIGSSKWSKSNIKKKKNMTRLGGEGLSLESFANAKFKSKDYNPGLLKKKREFYKNAKFVKKYKKALAQETQQSNQPSVMRPLEPQENKDEEDALKMNNGKKNKKSGARSLREVYERKHDEDEKARIEREAIIQKKREEKEKVIAKRKAAKEKMCKKTASGQPKMKYRMEQLLQNLQGS